MLTEAIANAVVGANYEKMPAAAIQIARMCLLDCLGVALAALREPTARIITEHVRQLGGKPECGVIGGGYRTCAQFSALANGTIAHALDFDDYAITSACHPTVVLFPAIFALASREGLPGRSIIEAYLAGWEVGSKLGNELAPALQGRGWHPTSTIGTLAATAACARLLRLTVSQTRTALGMAASQASGLNRNFGTDTKPFHAGNSAANAITAVLLAQQGFSANQTALEGPGGFCRVLAEKDCAAALPDMAEGMDILSSYAIKPYPACGLTHRCIEATIHLAGQHQIQPEQVALIECHVPPMFQKILVYPNPQNGLEGKFSMEYCIAAALLERRMTLRQFEDERVLSAQTRAIMPRVKMVFLQGVEHMNMVAIAQSVRIVLNDGTEYVHEVPWAKGSAGNPMSWDEVVDKFRNCAETTLSSREIARVIELLEKLESLETIDELMEILGNARPGSLR